MTPRLTPDQRQAIEEQQGKPVYVVDADTHRTYVLLPAEQYDRVKAAFEDAGEMDPREAYPTVDEVMREDDAKDATLAHYQRYTRNQP